jgi:hypothetical protein
MVGTLCIPKRVEVLITRLVERKKCIFEFIVGVISKYCVLCAHHW